MGIIILGEKGKAAAAGDVMEKEQIISKEKPGDGTETGAKSDTEQYISAETAETAGDDAGKQKTSGHIIDTEQDVADEGEVTRKQEDKTPADNNGKARPRAKKAVNTKK